MATIGYTSIGASETGDYINGSQLGCKFTCSSTDTYTTMYVYDKGVSASVNFKVAIYTVDGGGLPNTLVSESGGTAGSWTTSLGWASCGGLSANLTSGTEYFLVVSGDGTFHLVFDGGASNQTFDDFSSYGNFPATYPSADNFYPAVLSIYAETGAAAAPTIAWIKA